MEQEKETEVFAIFVLFCSLWKLMIIQAWIEFWFWVGMKSHEGKDREAGFERELRRAE